MKQVICCIVLATLLALALGYPQAAVKKPTGVAAKAPNAAQEPAMPGPEYFHQYKCYLKSVLESLTIIDKNKFSEANTKKLLDQKYEKEPEKKKKAYGMVEECGKKVVSITDPCECAYQLLKCFQIKNEELGLED